jgi:hypothetical protein
MLLGLARVSPPALAKRSNAHGPAAQGRQGDWQKGRPERGRLDVRWDGYWTPCESLSGPWVGGAGDGEQGSKAALSASTCISSNI